MWNLPSFDEAAQRAALAAVQKGTAAHKTARAVLPVLLAVAARVAATGGMKECLYPGTVGASTRPRHDLFPALEAGKTATARAYRAVVRDFRPRLIGGERPTDQKGLDALLQDIATTFKAVAIPPAREGAAKAAPCTEATLQRAVDTLEACEGRLPENIQQRLRALLEAQTSAAAH